MPVPRVIVKLKQLKTVSLKSTAELFGGQLSLETVMSLIDRLQRQEGLIKWFVTKHIITKRGMLQLSNILPWLKAVVEQAKRAESPKNETTRLRNAIYNSKLWEHAHNRQMAYRELCVRLLSMREELRKITSDARDAELPMLTLLSKERHWSSDPITHHSECTLIMDEIGQPAPQVYMIANYEARTSTYLLKKAKAGKSGPFMTQWLAAHKVVQALQGTNESQDKCEHVLDAALDNLPLALMSPAETCNLEKLRMLLVDMQTHFLSHMDNFDVGLTRVGTYHESRSGVLQRLEEGHKRVLYHSSFMHD